MAPRTIPATALLLLLTACGGRAPTAGKVAPPEPTQAPAPAPAPETPAAEPAPPVVETPATPAPPEPTSPPARPEGPSVKLRSQAAALSDADVVKALGRLGLRLPQNPSSTNLRGAWTSFKAHEIEAKTIGDVPVVVDRTTGLMWQATGSYKYSSSGLVKAADVKSYVAGLNAGKHAGFSNWRVPTLEELASVVDKQKHDKSWSLYPAFDLGAPWFALTTDAVKGDDSVVWTIDVGAGDLQKYSSTDEYYVLLVRTVK